MAWRNNASIWEKVLKFAFKSHEGNGLHFVGDNDT